MIKYILVTAAIIVFFGLFGRAIYISEREYLVPVCGEDEFYLQWFASHPPTTLKDAVLQRDTVKRVKKNCK